MKFSFKDITDSNIYQSAKVLFVCGPYNIFNNIAIDEIRSICKPDEQKYYSEGIMADFDIDGTDGISVSNNVDIDTFTKIVNTASMSGLWYCNANYAMLTKKHKDWLNSYIKSPSSNGRLVLYCNEFKDYRKLLKNTVINNSTQVHLIQLSFPYRSMLEQIVRLLFNGKGVKIEQDAIELFIMRMSSSYDDYEEIIDKIIAESVPKDKSNQVDKDWKYTVTYKDTLESMKGIENFVLDDFIDRLIEPLKTDKPSGRNKTYKMMYALIEEIGVRGLVVKLRYKVDDYIAFRLAINSGAIPIKVRFSVPEAKSRLGESHKLCKFSDYTFRRMATIASKTSLRDWEYMRLILNNTNGYSNEAQERVIYSLINRTVLNESRLNNDIGVESISNIALKQLNKIQYDDRLLGESKNDIANGGL